MRSLAGRADPFPAWSVAVAPEIVKASPGACLGALRSGGPVPLSGIIAGNRVSFLQGDTNDTVEDFAQTATFATKKERTMLAWIKRFTGRSGDEPTTGDVEPALIEAADTAVERATDRSANGAVDVETLVAMAMNTSPDEIGRDEFFEQMDRLLELSLDGEEVAAVMPLMQDHLERCRDCREEYEPFQGALEAVG